MNIAGPIWLQEGFEESPSNTPEATPSPASAPIASAMGGLFAKASMAKEAVVVKDGATKVHGQAIGMQPGAVNATGIQPGGVTVHASGIQPGGVTVCIEAGGVVLLAYLFVDKFAALISTAEVAEKFAPLASIAEAPCWPMFLAIFVVPLCIMARTMAKPGKQTSTDRHAFLRSQVGRAAGAMTKASDPELILDEEGNLVSLYKKDPTTGKETEELLTPWQVATCTRFFTLSGETVDGVPQVRVERCENVADLKVNLVAGATGSGKTSLIYILAGGMETPPKCASDTKCPNVYFLSNGEGDDMYAFLDTAGLCDTAAMAKTGVGMQELLINAVAATVGMYNLDIVTFLMCVDMAGRLPGNFGDVWPQMQVSLGGDQLGKLCHFVVTKANGDSPVNKLKLKNLPNEEFYNELVCSSLKWPVIHAGRDNLSALEAVLKPVSTAATGIGRDAVDTQAQSLASKKQLANRIEADVSFLKARLVQGDQTTIGFSREMRRLRGELDNAYEELASLGNCKNAEKTRLRALIDAKKRQLSVIDAKQAENQCTREQTQTELEKWELEFKKQMEDIRKMHSLGAFFRNLCGGACGDSNGLR